MSVDLAYIPTRGPMVDAKGCVTPEWLHWFRQLVGGTSATAAASTSATTGSTTGSGGVTNVTNTTVVEGDTTVIETPLEVTGVEPGLYGDNVNVPQLQIDAYGRITFAGTVPVSGGGGGEADPHNLLSAQHIDTTTASPQAGDMIVGSPASTPDVTRGWIGGRVFDYLPTSRTVGTSKYWSTGLAASGLTHLGGAVKWERRSRGTPGYVWTASATGAEWQPPSGGSSGSGGGGYGAAAYLAGDTAVGANFPAIATQVSFGATSHDDDGLWTAVSPARLTIPADGSGRYLVLAQATLQVALGTASVQLVVKKNGVEIRRGPNFGSNSTYLQNVGQLVIPRVELNTGDYVELWIEVEHGSLAYYTLRGGATATFLHVGRL